MAKSGDSDSNSEKHGSSNDTDPQSDGKKLIEGLREMAESRTPDDKFWCPNCEAYTVSDILQTVQRTEFNKENELWGCTDCHYCFVPATQWRPIDTDTDEKICTDGGQEERETVKEQVLYLTTIRCDTCSAENTFAHVGPPTPIDQDAPWPNDVEWCPACGFEYPDDLAAVIDEVKEAGRSLYTVIDDDFGF